MKYQSETLILFSDMFRNLGVMVKACGDIITNKEVTVTRVGLVIFSTVLAFSECAAASL